MGITFTDERRNRGITGEPAVPIWLAIDFDRSEHGWETGRSEQHIGCDFPIAEDAAASGSHARRGDKQLDRRTTEAVEVDGLGEDVAQRI